MVALKSRAVQSSYKSWTTPPDSTGGLERLGSPTHIASRLYDPAIQFLVGTSGCTLSAMGYVQYRATHAFVSDLYVYPTRRGFGSVLLNHLVDVGHTWGLSRFACTVFDRNLHGMQFFIGHGFTPRSRQASRSFPEWYLVRLEKRIPRRSMPDPSDASLPSR